MGYLFDERKFISSNAEWLNTHLSSQYSRFMDSPPTYVVYYNINNIESTVDLGFRNIEKMLGKNSPVRFNRIEGLPVYGIDQIVPTLEEGEEGLNYSYDGDGIILPNTIKPIPNDFFYIETLGKRFIFMITAVSPGSIDDDGYKQFEFTLKHMNEEKIDDLERQTVDRFECYAQNIGTEEKVLVRSEDVQILNKLNEITSEISNYYLILFYDRKYNSFLFNRGDRTRLYDRLLTHFINKNKVFFQRNDYETILLTSEDPNQMLLFEYHNSIYRAIEEKKPELIKPMFYGEGLPTDFSSIFYHWGDQSIRTTFFNIGTNPYLNMEHVEVFKDAKEFYVTKEVEVEVPAVGNVDISIPVGDNEVFTQDAGYNFNTKKSDPVQKEYDSLKEERPIVQPKGKLSMQDLVDVVASPSSEPNDITLTLSKPPMDLNISKDKEEVKFEGQVKVTNLVDKVIEHITKEPIGMDIVGITITKYLSGNAPELSDLDIEELINYADYMQPNRVTFILIPILLFVLESYYKTSISNN